MCCKCACTVGMYVRTMYIRTCIISLTSHLHTYHSGLKCMCTFLHGASALTTIDIQVCLVAMFVLPDLTNVCNFCGVSIAIQLSYFSTCYGPKITGYNPAVSSYLLAITG